MRSVGKAFLAVEMFVSEITLRDFWLVFKTGIALNVEFCKLKGDN